MADFAKTSVACASSTGTRLAATVSLAAVLALASVAPPATAAPRAPVSLSGRIVAVADGDTLTLLDDSFEQHRIRLGAVDTPERAQPFGNVAKSSLSGLAFGRTAQALCAKTDRYHRLVCTVRVDGRDVGLVQIERGLGWHYKRYEKEQSPDDRLAYAAAEREARAAHRGLWVDRDPVPPWDWRHAKRFPLRPDPLGRLRPGSLESEERP